MNTPVSFETAKLLKEKGFDEQWNIYMHTPTLAEVVMWLYEEHGIHIEILLSEDHPWNSFYYRVMKVGNYFTLSHNGDYRKSPTEAYESAIEYCLKNII